MKPIFDRHGMPCRPGQATGTTGLLAGAEIMTLAGERPVADLRPGDRIVTRDRGAARLAHMRTRTVATALVRIAARSLGHNRPEGDSLLPAGQPVLVRDWRAQVLFGAQQALVPVARLVDGEFVTLLPVRQVTVHDLIFDAPHVLYVDGLELASHFEGAPLR